MSSSDFKFDLAGFMKGVFEGRKSVVKGLQDDRFDTKSRSLFYLSSDRTDLVRSRTGGIDWKIDGSGVLEIAPSGKGDPVLPDMEHGADGLPWKHYLNFIQGVKVHSGVIANENCKGLFANMPSCKFMDVKDLDTSRVVNMNGIFSGNYELRDVDLTGWNTQHVTDMCSFFERCFNLENVNVSGLDTRNVTDMSYMFCHCSALKSLDLSTFDTGNVKSMQSMFDNCRYLTQLDLENFDTKNVTDMRAMFIMCNRMETVNVSNFDTRSVEDMRNMFAYCDQLEFLDLDHFDYSNVKDLSGMFMYCESLDVLSFDGKSFSKCETMSSMFEGCSNLRKIELAGVDTSSVKYMDYLFKDCGMLECFGKYDPVIDFDTSSVVSGESMFGGDTSRALADRINFVNIPGADHETVVERSDDYYSLDDMASDLRHMESRINRKNGAGNLSDSTDVSDDETFEFGS